MFFFFFFFFFFFCLGVWWGGVGKGKKCSLGKLILKMNSEILVIIGL